MTFFKGVILGAALIASNPVLANDHLDSIRVYEDKGGDVDDRVNVVHDLRYPVRIEGECDSACTMYLGYKDVCISPHAKLGFHAAHNWGPDGAINRYGTNTMKKYYNQNLNWYLYSVGAMDRQTLTYLTGREVISLGYKECDR